MKNIRNNIKQLTENHPVLMKTAGILPVVWTNVYAVFNLILSIYYKSWWHLSLGAWFLIIGLLKVYIKRSNNNNSRRKLRIARAGIVGLGIVLAGIITMGIAEGHNPARGLIVMVAIAAYTFGSLTAAIIKSVKAAKKKDDDLLIDRYISLMGAVGALMSLERGMLGTFSDTSSRFSLTMEITTGFGAFLLITVIGVILFFKKPYPSDSK